MNAASAHRSNAYRDEPGSTSTSKPMTNGASIATYAVATTTATSHRRRKRENGWIIHQCVSKFSSSFVSNRTAPALFSSWSPCVRRASTASRRLASREREKNEKKETRGFLPPPRRARRGAAADIRRSLALSMRSAASGSPHSNTYLSLEKSGSERCAALRLVSRRESARASSSSRAIFAEPQDFWRDKRGCRNDGRGEGLGGGSSSGRSVRVSPSGGFPSPSPFPGCFARASAGRSTIPSSSTIAAEAVWDPEEDAEEREPASEREPDAPVRSPMSPNAR